jgi:hypothetical protein
MPIIMVSCSVISYYKHSSARSFARYFCITTKIGTEEERKEKETTILTEANKTMTTRKHIYKSYDI